MASTWSPTGAAPGRTQGSLGTVLAAVASSAVAMSRADLATRCGLTKATVSTQVDRLLRARLLVEGDPVPRSGAGRPAAGLGLCGDRVAAIGMDIGVDHLAGCVRDLSGAVRHVDVVVADHRDRPAGDVLAAAADLLRGLRRDAAADGLVVAGLGVGVPGLVDAGRGQVLLAPNLGWGRVDIGSALGGAAGAAGPVVVENEATLGALAEMGYPAGRTGSDVDAGGGFIVVSGGVGIGAGLVMDGRLVLGRHGWSGELGHVTVDAGGGECRCGARGCLEVFAGQEAILAAAGRGDLLSVDGRDAVGAPDALGAVLATAGAGEPSAVASLSRAGRALGVALSAAVNLLDVDAVVLGGIYARLAPWVVPEVERELAVRVLRSRLRPVRVVVSTIGPDAAMLGAAALVLRGVLAAPGPWLDA